VASRASPPSSMYEMYRLPLSLRRNAPGGAHDGVRDRWPALQMNSVKQLLRLKAVDSAEVRRSASKCKRSCALVQQQLLRTCLQR
jgi:hypothetical protein